MDEPVSHKLVINDDGTFAIVSSDSHALEYRSLFEQHQPEIERSSAVGAAHGKEARRG